MKIVEIWKELCENVVNDWGNVGGGGGVGKFWDLEVVGVWVRGERERIDSEKWLLEYKLEE